MGAMLYIPLYVSVEMLLRLFRERQSILSVLKELHIFFLFI